MSFDLILPFLRPIEPLLLDESVSEIMGNPDATWWYERDGIVRPEASVQFDAGKLRTGLEVIANHLGKTPRRRQSSPARTTPRWQPPRGSDSPGCAACSRAHDPEVHEPPIHHR